MDILNAGSGFLLVDLQHVVSAEISSLPCLIWHCHVSILISFAFKLGKTIVMFPIFSSTILCAMSILLSNK